MKPTRNSRRDGGFTLIEVLIAFTILAIVLGVAFRALSTGLGHERTADLVTARVLAARSVLDRVGLDIPLEAGTTGGELATGEEWALEIAAVEFAALEVEDPDALKAYRVTLSVEGADGRALRLETLRLER